MQAYRHWMRLNPADIFSHRKHFLYKLNLSDSLWHSSCIAFNLFSLCTERSLFCTVPPCFVLLSSFHQCFGLGCHFLICSAPFYCIILLMIRTTQKCTAAFTVSLPLSITRLILLLLHCLHIMFHSSSLFLCHSVYLLHASFIPTAERNLLIQCDSDLPVICCIFSISVSGALSDSYWSGVSGSGVTSF